MENQGELWITILHILFESRRPLTISGIVAIQWNQIRVQLLTTYKNSGFFISREGRPSAVGVDIVTPYDSTGESSQK